MAKRQSKHGQEVFNENEVAKYDEIFAEDAKKYAAKEKLAGGQFLSLKAGVMSFGGEQLEGNCVYAVILHSIHTNLLYTGEYNPDVPQSPSCFAIGDDEESLRPHADAEEPACETCVACENNQWGSAERGRSKACANTRRLALIVGGSYDKKTKEFTAYEDPDDFKESEMAFLKLPVTSVKAYSDYVHQLASTLSRPPWGVITRIAVKPDQKSQFKLTFELAESIANDVVPAVKARHDAAKDAIMFGFPKFDEEEKATAPKARSKAAAGKKAPAKRSKKY